MASISPLLFLALSISIGGLHLQISDPQLTYQNPNNTLIFSIVNTSLYFLIPITFLLGMLLLPCHLIKPKIDSPLSVFIFTMVTRALLSATLLLVASLIATYSYSIPMDKEIDEAICRLVVSLCLLAVVVHWAVYHAPLFAICVSVGTLMFAEPLLSNFQQLPYNPLFHIPIVLLIYIQIPFTFILGMALLLIHVARPGFSAQRLDMTLRGMVLTTLISGTYVMAYLGLADVAVIRGGATEIGVP